MNQDIIVDDDLDWQPERQGIAFTAHWQGRKIDCFLALAHLEHMTGQSLIDEGNIMLAFESVRFGRARGLVLDRSAREVMQELSVDVVGYVPLHRGLDPVPRERVQGVEPVGLDIAVLEHLVERL